MNATLAGRSALLLRAGLLGTAIILLSAGASLRDTIPTGGGWPAYIVPALVWTGAAAILALCLLPQLRPWMRGVVLAGLLGALGSYAYIQMTLYAPLYWTRTDNEMIGEYAVEVLQSGQNPYTWDYSDMTRVFRDRGNRTTQFLDNSTQRRVTYPAFPTLLLYAFDSVGLGQARTVTFLFLGGLMVLMFAGAPPDYRPVILLPLFVQKDFIVLSLIGAQDVVWSALLVAMLLTWKRPIWRAALFGLAVNFRQQPWFIAPFLLLHLWDEGGTHAERLRRMAVFTGIAGGMFVLFNLPFFVMNPVEWVLSALEPSYARFNVFSQGLAALTQYGLLPLTRDYYTLLHLGSYVCLLYVGIRHRRDLGQAFWMIPAVFFWLYYRGLGNYWFYWLPPLTMAMLVLRQRAPVPEVRAHWRSTALAGGACVMVMLVLALLPAFRSERVSARIIAPVELTPAGEVLVERLHVRVTNHGPEAFRPRFSVQYERVTEIYTWIIESGPDWLAAGESADYVISAEGARGKMFAPQRGAQVVVNDAGLDYRWRAVATVPSPEEFPAMFQRGGEPVPASQLSTGDSESLARVIRDPAAYYITLAEQYAALGEVSAARRAYAQAIVYDANNARAVAGLAALDDTDEGE